MQKIKVYVIQHKEFGWLLDEFADPRYNKRCECHWIKNSEDDWYAYPLVYNSYLLAKTVIEWHQLEDSAILIERVIEI